MEDTVYWFSQSPSKTQIRHARSDVTRSGLGPPTSHITQDNIPHRLIYRHFLSWGPLLPKDSSLCQADKRKKRICTYTTIFSKISVFNYTVATGDWVRAPAVEDQQCQIPCRWSSRWCERWMEAELWSPLHKLASDSYVAKDELEPLTLLVVPLQCWHFWCVPPCPFSVMQRVSGILLSGTEGKSTCHVAWHFFFFKFEFWESNWGLTFPQQEVHGVVSSVQETSIFYRSLEKICNVISWIGSP